MEKPEALPRAVKEEKKGRGSGRRKSSVRQQRQKWEKEELEEIKEEEEAEAEMVMEYMDSDEEEKKKPKKKRTKEVEEEQEEEQQEEAQVSSSQGVLEQQEEEETYSVPPIQHWVPRTWKQNQDDHSLSFQQVELSSSNSSGSTAPVRCTVVGRHGRSVFVGAPPTPLPPGRHGACDQMSMVSLPQLQAHLRHLQDKLSTKSIGEKRAPRRSGRATAIRLQLQAAVTPWIGNLLLPNRRSFCRAELLAARCAEPPQLSTPFFRILLLALRVDSNGCKDTIDNKKSSKCVQATQARPPGSTPAHMMNPKTIGGMLQRRAMGVESQQRLTLNKLGATPSFARGLRLLRPLPQPRPQLLLQFPPTLSPRTVFCPKPLQQAPPTPSIHLLTPMAPPPLTSLTFPSPPPPFVHLLPNAVPMNPILCTASKAPHTPTNTPPVISPAPLHPGVTQTGPAPRPLVPLPPSPQCPAGDGTLKVLQEAAVGGTAGAEVVDGRRPRRLSAKAKALMQATATKVTKVLPPAGGRCLS